MPDRVRIRTLRDAGHTLEEIAATVGVGKRSVQRIVKEPTIEDAESAPTPVSRGVGRPSTVELYQDHVERILKEEPSLPTVEVLSRLRRALLATAGQPERFRRQSSRLGEREFLQSPALP